MNSARGYPDDIYRLHPEETPTFPAVPFATEIAAVLAIVWRARLAMAGGALLGLALALGGLALGTPTFTATARVDFAATGDAVPGLGDELAFLRSDALMARVAERTGLASHPAFDPAGTARFTAAAPLEGLFAMPGMLLRATGLGGGARDGAGEADAAARAGRLLAARLHLVPGARSIAISAATGDPDLSARLVNAVADEYVLARHGGGLAATRETASWLNARIEELETTLKEAEAAVEAERTHLAGADPDALAAERHALHKSLAAAATARAAAELRYRKVRAAIDDPAAPAAAALEEAPAIADGRARVRRLAEERADLARRLAPGDPRLAALDAAIAAASAEIAGEAERVALVLYRDVTVARAQERRLESESRALDERVAGLKHGEATLSARIREADTARLLHETFLARFAAGGGGQAGGGTVAIAPAERPVKADGTPAARLAATGTALGMTAGLAIAVLLGHMQNTFRTLEEVEERTGLPILGAVPMMPEEASAEGEEGGVVDYVMRRPTSPLAEAIRSLRTNLFLCQSEGPPQVVAFTSSLPQEGKTTTSLLLALASAQMGRATIVVDCDLRRPALSGMLGAVGSARGGLRAVLDGALKLEEACLKDPETGLAILPTRVEPGDAVNAADLLASPRFAALLAELRRRHELVILDVPPTLSVADARLVARLADATFYCVRWDSTPRDTVEEGLRDLALARPNIAGAVVTMIDRPRLRGVGSMVGTHPARDLRA